MGGSFVNDPYKLTIYMPVGVGVRGDPKNGCSVCHFAVFENKSLCNYTRAKGEKKFDILLKFRAIYDII